MKQIFKIFQFTRLEKLLQSLFASKGTTTQYISL